MTFDMTLILLIILTGLLFSLVYLAVLLPLIHRSRAAIKAHKLIKNKALADYEALTEYCISLSVKLTHLQTDVEKLQEKSNGKET